MTELQSKLVDMLSWFHDMCEKNGLRYYIIAGTMLGAVRHKGFIPWDDDIDVGMPRSDYEKLSNMVCEKQEGRYIFEYPSLENKEYNQLFAKLYDTQTTFIEKQRYPMKRGIYIDVFPLDGIGNNDEDIKKNYKVFYRKYVLNLMITGPFLKRRSFSKNAAVFLGRIISPLFVNRYKLAQNIDDICRRYDFDEMDFVCNLMGGIGVRGCVPREYFGKPTLVQFESLMVYGLEKPDLYLKAMYGDYMKLPPTEKQISLHDSIEYNLNKSYLES